MPGLPHCSGTVSYTHLDVYKRQADDSYGIEVAKLAGLPGSVTRRAHEVLRALEASAPKSKVEQMDFDALQEYASPAVPSEMMEQLEALDVETQMCIRDRFWAGNSAVTLWKWITRRASTGFEASALSPRAAGPAGVCSIFTSMVPL